jgi:glutaminyl-tRNA synthetase
VKWLGFSWSQPGNDAPYQASDYFDFMYRAAEHLIEAGHAYVDEQTAEEMRVNRGDFGKPGVNSPFRRNGGRF